MKLAPAGVPRGGLYVTEKAALPAMRQTQTRTRPPMRDIGGRGGGTLTQRDAQVAHRIGDDADRIKSCIARDRRSAGLESRPLDPSGQILRPAVQVEAPVGRHQHAEKHRVHEAARP